MIAQFYHLIGAGKTKFLILLINNNLSLSYRQKRKWAEFPITRSRRSKEDAKHANNSDNSIKGELEYDFNWNNILEDFLENSRLTDDPVISNSDPSYRHDDDEDVTLSAFLEGNNPVPSDGSSYYKS